MTRSARATSFAPIWIEVHRALDAVPPAFADMPWRDGGWTRKQIVGHLLDSAANNRQRFVRAAIDGSMPAPVRAGSLGRRPRLCHQPWETLLAWWEAEHEILMAVVDRIPEDKLEAQMHRRRRPAGYAALPHRGLRQPPALASETDHDRRT